MIRSHSALPSKSAILLSREWPQCLRSNTPLKIRNKEKGQVAKPEGSGIGRQSCFYAKKTTRIKSICGVLDAYLAKWCCRSHFSLEIMRSNNCYGFSTFWALQMKSENRKENSSSLVSQAQIKQLLLSIKIFLKICLARAPKPCWCLSGKKYPSVTQPVRRARKSLRS